MKKYIISNETEITAENVQLWIDGFTGVIQPRLIELDSYYQGEDKIISYPYEKRAMNTQVHINLAYMTVQNFVAYSFGKEPTQDYHASFKYGDYIDDLKFSNNEILEDKALETDCSRFGLAYEFIGVKDKKGKKEPFYKRLDPITTFLVTDDTILENEVCYITYTIVKPKNEAEYRKGYIYTKGYIREFTYKGTVQLGEPEPNTAYPDEFPIVMYKNNENIFGDYEPAREILSLYSKIFSLGGDDISGVANAILAFFNVDLPDEEREKLNRTRVVSLMGENSDAKYIYKKLDSSFFKMFQEALRREYYAITNEPDFTDINSYAKSGVAVSFKLIGAENVRRNKSAYFEQGLRKRWNIIATYVGYPFEINKNDMSYQFYNNLPNNVQADLEYAELVEKGLLSRETAMQKMETVTDVEGELARIKKEEKERILSTLSDVTGINIPSESKEYERKDRDTSVSNVAFPFSM